MASASSTSTTKLELRTAYGPVYRDVLNTPPRDCRNDEIPIIDLDRLFSDQLSERKSLAKEIRSAAVNTGFFYIKNHGIPEPTIQSARQELLNFFRQPLSQKLPLSKENFTGLNGYTPPGHSLTNKTNGIDSRESFSWQYDPKHDPIHGEGVQVPEETKPFIYADPAIWPLTFHLPNFQSASLEYWSSCLMLSRRLVRIFALALHLPEDYFDSRTTFPGADGVYNYYPPAPSFSLGAIENENIGLGSHTDLQLFTLLWQDYTTSSLQILNPEGQWIKAVPVPETIVVNIGDFLMRLSNDLFKSTVHRVSSTHSGIERVSMPFFFGLNFNCVEGVVPTCTSESNPPRYEPISCGEWCHLRFKQERADAAKARGAPSGKVVAAY